MARLPRRVADGSSLVLAYHNIVSNGEQSRGDTSLHLTLSSFETQLAIAAQEADVVSLATLEANHGRKGRRVAITFDDAYLGCVKHGIAACTSAGVEPTVFVAPALLGHFPPWDVRSEGGDWGPRQREEFLAAGGYVRGAASYAGPGSRLPESYRIATIDELTMAMQEYAFTVGNHTMHHANLSACDEPTILREVLDCEAFLNQHFSVEQRSTALAYPYGRAPRIDLSAKLGACTERGYLVSGGWIGPREAIRGYALNRLNVPAGARPAAFRSMLRGWIGSRPSRS